MIKLIKKSAFLSVVASLAFAGTGCQNMNTVERNTAAGAAIGAGAGAIIADDNPWAGAAIGAAAGGAGGWLYGKNKQKRRGY